MPFEGVICPECKAYKDLTQVEPDTFYCPYHKGLFKYVRPSRIVMNGERSLCSCGTFAVGVCSDCAIPVCTDCSSIVDSKRACKPCGLRRAERAQQDADRARKAEAAAKASAKKSAIEDISETPDSVERLLRVAYFTDRYGAQKGTWTKKCPEYENGKWDSTAIGRWFAAKAKSLGIHPTSSLKIYRFHPPGLLLGKFEFRPEKELPCWSFREGSIETTRIEDTTADFGSPDRYYTVTEWVHILLDGRVVTYQIPPHRVRGVDDDYEAGRERIQPSGLNARALVLMASILRLTNDVPNLTPVPRPQPQLFGRALYRNSQPGIDDYGRRIG